MQRRLNGYEEIPFSKEKAVSARIYCVSLNVLYFVCLFFFFLLYYSHVPN